MPSSHPDPHKPSGALEDGGFEVGRIGDHDRPARLSSNGGEPLGHPLEDGPPKRAVHENKQVAGGKFRQLCVSMDHVDRPRLVLTGPARDIVECSLVECAVGFDA